MKLDMSEPPFEIEKVIDRLHCSGVVMSGKSSFWFVRGSRIQKSDLLGDIYTIILALEPSDERLYQENVVRKITMCAGKNKLLKFIRSKQQCTFLTHTGKSVTFVMPQRSREIAFAA